MERPAKRRRPVIPSSDDEIETPVKPTNTKSDCSGSTKSRVLTGTGSTSLPLLPSRTSSETRLNRSYSSSPEKRKKNGKQASKNASTTKSLHSFFQPASEEQRWSSQKFGARHPTDPPLTETLEDNDDLIEDDYDSYDEIFTQHLNDSKLGGRDKSQSQFAQHVGSQSRLSQSQFCSATATIDTSSRKFHSSGKRFPALPGSTAGAPRERLSLTGDYGEDKRPWAQRFAPVNLDELAVHKKKVADIRAWLEGVFAGKNRQRLLVLRGPAGCGKTTTISLLSKAIGFDVLEWRNPSVSEYKAKGYTSVGAQFEEFLGRSDKFGGLVLDDAVVISREREDDNPPPSSRRIILIEEFPSIWTGMSSALAAFRSSLQRYLAATVPLRQAGFASMAVESPESPPIVIIVSETLLSSASAVSDNFTVHRLLGPLIYNHPGTCIVDFNSIAPTFMLKALNLVLKKEARLSGRVQAPGPTVLKTISEIGDIRSAISSLEFLCLKGDRSGEWGGSSLATRSKRTSRSNAALTSTERQSLEMITQREASLGIFHAVGKIVYNKREDASLAAEDVKLPPPPDYLRHHDRPKVSQVSVNELVEETGTDIQTFICALHENYVLSCDGSDFTDYLDGCIEALSDSDILGTHPRGLRRSRTGIGIGTNLLGAGVDMLRQDEISIQVATRGLLFALPHPVKRRVASTDGRGRAGDAHKMFFPTLLRQWSEFEQIEGLIDLWMKRSLDPFTRPGIVSIGSNTMVKSEGVKSWKKSLGVGMVSSAEQPRDWDDTQAMTVTMVSRDDMVLHQWPYMAKILRDETERRELEKIIALRGIEAPSDDLNDVAFDGHDEPTASPSSKSRLFAKGQGSNAFGPKLPPSVDEEEKLILSDDDIEE